MSKIAMILSLVHLMACASNSKEVSLESTPPLNSYRLKRSLSIMTRDTNGHCQSPSPKNMEDPEIELEMEPFSKGKASGNTALHQFRAEVDKVPFMAELRVTKKEGEESFLIYLMLRSGHTRRRNGKVMTLSVKDLTRFSEIILKDDPIQSHCGTLQAELRVAPAKQSLSPLHPQSQ